MSESRCGCPGHGAEGCGGTVDNRGRCERCGGGKCLRQFAGVQYPSEKMSGGERLFWFQMWGVKLPRPQYQFRFDVGRKWRFDFAYVPERIAIDIQGMGRTNTDGQRVAGASAHRTVKGYDNDLRKYNAANCDGWLVLLFTTAQVKEGYALKTLEGALRSKGAIPR